MAEVATPTTFVPSDEPTPLESGKLDLRRLGERLEVILRESSSESEATTSFVAVARQLTRARAAVYFGLDQAQQLGADPCSQVPADVSQSVLDTLYLLARKTQDAAIAQLVQASDDPPQIALAVPVFRRDERVDVLTLLCDTSVDDRGRIAGLLQMAQLLAAFMGQWRGRFDQLRNYRKLDLLESLLRAANTANKSLRSPEAAEAFADFLAQHFHARLVALGTRRYGGICRLVGLSHRFPVRRGAPLIGWIEAALAERLAISEPEAIERVDVVERGTEAVRQLRALLDTRAIYRIVLRDGSGAVTGGVLAVREQPLAQDEEENLRQACEFIGPHFSRLREARLSWWHRGRVAFDTLTPRRRRAVIIAAWAAVLLLFALPVPYRIAGRCEVQPVIRRFVAAPYEGRLQDALVEPGDLVKAGQVLAIMDGREIRLELSGIEAELQRVTKQRDRALANRETAAAQIALLEMQRLQSNMQLYQDRLENLEIRSPTDGVVISGDPQKLKGARLTIGQTLLEVGTLGDMVLEVAIPDEKIAHARETSSVRFRLDAMPQRSLNGQLTRIHPRAEVRESQNVFVGEVELAEEVPWLRPGMRGRAKLASGYRSLYWILFHRAIDRALFLLGR